MADEMVQSELDRLHTLEAVIEKKIKAFLEVGEALIEIREGKLYRATYPTFETYCSERWGFTSARARQLMLATKTQQELTVDLPNESAARALARYPAPLHESIALIAQAQADYLGKGITTGMITSIGDVLTQAAVTGAISVDGETSAFDAVLTEEAYEVMQRQRQHISDGFAVKVAPLFKGTAHIETVPEKGGVIVLDAPTGTLDTLPGEFRLILWPFIENEIED